MQDYYQTPLKAEIMTSKCTCPQTVHLVHQLLAVTRWLRIKCQARNIESLQNFKTRLAKLQFSRFIADL